MALTDDLELSFRAAWLLLYTAGVGPGYIAALKSFIRAGIQAYGGGYSLTALNLELLTQERATGHPDLDELLRLNTEETEIRSIWLRLIYVTLRQIGYPQTQVTPDLGLTGQEDLVRGVIAASQEGFTLEGLKLELVLEGGGSERSAGETAILSQWMRIVFF